MVERRPPPPDQQYRDRIANDLDCTMLVEAAAGTGKTTCLVDRMINLLSQGRTRIETLAAITFTRKAAAELRTRFQVALEQAIHDSADDHRDRLVMALDRVERCFIGTIHSFCARLLRERPVEARVDPGFVEIDDTIDTRLREQAWREHVAALVAESDPVLPELEKLGLKVSSSTRRSSSPASELDELGLEPAELGPSFLRFAEYSDVEDWPAQSVPLPDHSMCRSAVSDYAAHMRSLSLPEEHGNDTLMPKYELIGRMAARLDLDQPAQLMELLEQFEASVKVVQKVWPGKKAQALEEKARWDEFVQAHVEPVLLKWREHRYEPVMRAIRPTLDVYERLRRERNGLNFQDLLLRSAALLRDKPEVRRYFRERFTHVLVDEFQDTDPIQAEVMLLLTADNCGEVDWQRCRPAPGSLFVVGDPKQSVYRFRRADIQTYNKVRSIIELSGGEVIPLSANFRSVKPLVDWVNSCFNNIFPSRADSYSPANRPLEVGRIDGADVEPVVERLPALDDRRYDAVALHEADLMARTIRRAMDEQWPVPRTVGELNHGLPEHAQAGDFLIIARSKARLTLYARRLQKYGIPHAVTGGRALNEVPELELLHICLSALVRSDDPVALVTVLRSELFGIPDTLLYKYKRIGGHFSYNAQIPEGLAADDVDILSEAFQRLQTYSGWLRRVPVAAAMERIAADLGLVARAAAAEEGDIHAGSFLKTSELLRSVEGQLTLGNYVDALARLVDMDEHHDGTPVRPPVEMPVRVMNLHQCKGLEAPFVFLVDPSGDTEHNVYVHIDRSGERPKGFLPIYGRRRQKWGSPPLLAQPPGWDELASCEQSFLDAENSRLLYVAATRAGVKLVISQRDGNRNQKNPWRKFDEYLQPTDACADPGPVSAKPAVPIAIDPDKWHAAVDAIESRWQVIRQPTYAVEAIKELAITGRVKPHGAEKKGAEWGQVLHALLEAAMKQPRADLHGLALSMLEQEELPLTLVDDVLATVERVIESELWQRARAANRCLTEVPLAMPVSASETSNGLPTVLRGVIDLAFQEDAGWVIVDYKSERVEERDIPALVDYYRPQVEAYSDAWEAITGQTVSERGVLFTHFGKYVRT